MRVAVVLGLLATLATGQLRIDHASFNDSEQELRVLFEETISAFPKSPLPPLYLKWSVEGPRTLFDRTPRGEIIIELRTRPRYHAQLIYQFAHELTHIRTGLRREGHDQKWFEETLCETASLFALRRLSEKWRKDPKLRSESLKLHDYAQKIIASRQKLALSELSSFYQKHEAALRKNPKLRSLNGAMAATLLPLFQAEPERWNTITTLNQEAAKPDLTLPAYFLKWHQDSTPVQQPFILELAKVFR